MGYLNYGVWPCVDVITANIYRYRAALATSQVTSISVTSVFVSIMFASLFAAPFQMFYSRNECILTACRRMEVIIYTESTNR